jgi:hypothetical protein
LWRNVDFFCRSESDGGLEKSMPHPLVTKVGRSIATAMRLATGIAMVLPLLWKSTDAAEIRLLSAAAMQSVFKDITADFERTSGHKLNITPRSAELPRVSDPARPRTSSSVRA